MHQENPPITVDDLRRIRVFNVNTRKLCWSNKSVKRFLTVESACLPCVSHGTSSFWRALDNHNRTCERMIGKMGTVLKNKWVQDDEKDDLDDRIREFV